MFPHRERESDLPFAEDDQKASALRVEDVLLHTRFLHFRPNNGQTMSSLADIFGGGFLYA